MDNFLKNLENLNSTTNSTDMTQNLGWLIPTIIIASTIGIILYIYSALTLYTIAKKLNHSKPWFAWIPIVNIFLIYNLSETPKWTIICYFIGLVTTIIPVIGVLIGLGLTILTVWWYWAICEKLNRPGWWSIFSLVFYPVFLVMLGIMAWSDTTEQNSRQTQIQPE